MPAADYFLCGVEVLKENWRRYDTAHARARLQPKSPIVGFMRPFVTAHALKVGGEEQ